MIIKEDKRSGKSYELELDLASDPEYQRRFASVFDFQFESRQVKPFVHKNWKTIGLPHEIDGMDNSIEPGFTQLDFRFPTLNRDWLQTILEFFQPGGPEPVTMIGFCLGNVAYCEPDSWLIGNIFSSEFHCMEDVYIVDSSMKWGIRSSYADLSFVAAERELMDAFLAGVGGENLVEYFFALCMDYRRQVEVPRTLQWVYRAIDWEMPFEVSDHDRKLSAEELEKLIDKTELEICKRFGVDPSMRPRYID
jgi:hypothetical protein